MKIEFEMNQDIYDLRDALFVALLKQQRKDAAESVEWHKDDKKMNRQIVKACDLLLTYYGAV